MKKKVNKVCTLPNKSSVHFYRPSPKKQGFRVLVKNRITHQLEEHRGQKHVHLISKSVSIFEADESKPEKMQESQT